MLYTADVYLGNRVVTSLVVDGDSKEDAISKAAMELKIEVRELPDRE